MAANNIAGINRYSLSDAQPLKGVSYYRLKQIDKDARIAYSNIVRIYNTEGYSVSLYPNPALHSITVTHPQAGNESYIKIATVDGRVIKAVKAKEGFTTMSIDEISVGTYFVQFVNRNDIISQQFIKQ